MEQDEVVRRVKLYLEKAKDDFLVEMHPLEKKGYWEIISGGMGDFGTTYTIKTVHGRFIDVVDNSVDKNAKGKE